MREKQTSGAALGGDHSQSQAYISPLKQQKPAVVNESAPRIFNHADDDHLETSNLPDGNSNADRVPEDIEKQDYYLDEFGKLQLPYSPSKIGIFSGSLGVTYIMMSVDTNIIVFVI